MNKYIQIEQANDEKNFTSTTNDPCGYNSDTTDSEIEKTEIKERIDNYKDDLVEQQVIDPTYSDPFVISKSQLLSFFEENEDADGVRVYLSKATKTKEKDFEIILIPCRYDDTKKYFEDLIPRTDADVFLLIPFCRRPPGCRTLGASFKP